MSLITAETAVPEPLRALALRALAVQLQDRSRHAQGISAIHSGGQAGFLSLLLHRSIASLAASGNAPAPAPDTAAAASTSTVPQPAGSEPSGAVAPLQQQQQQQPPTYSLEYVESLLVLVQAMIGSSAGGMALADAGVIAALMPLVRSRDPDHLGLVTAAVKVLEGYIDFSGGAAAAAFGESQVLQELVARLAFEVGLDAEGKPAAAAAAEAEGSAAPMEASSGGAAPEQGGGAGEASAPAAAAAEAAAAAPATTATQEGAGAVAPTGGCEAQRQAAAAPAVAAAAATAAVGASRLPYARTTLIKFLMRCLALACFSPQSTAASRPSESQMGTLYRSLGAVLRDSGRFGGSLFALAASVVSDCLHSDPLQYRQLDEAGVPQAYLDAVKVGRSAGGQHAVL